MHGFYKAGMIATRTVLTWKIRLKFQIWFSALNLSTSNLIAQNINLIKLSTLSGLKEWVKVSKITSLWNYGTIVSHYFALKIKDFTYQRVENKEQYTEKNIWLGNQIPVPELVTYWLCMLSTPLWASIFVSGKRNFGLPHPVSFSILK